MTRRCSHCGNNGHNLRTCPVRACGRGGGGGVKLFGVRLTEGVGLGHMSMKKSASMGNLSTFAAAAAANDDAGGYNSDDPAHGSSRSERKKGTPWTEEEHRLFLMGLQKLGKGDWRGIARNFVVSRTPTQVASHAQKFFIRQTNVRKKRRTSLFDMVPEMPIDEIPVIEEQQLMLHCTASDQESTSQLLSVHFHDQESRPMEPLKDAAHKELGENEQYNNAPLPVPVIPSFYPALIPVPLPFWPAMEITAPPEEVEMSEPHEVLKPTPVHPKEPTNMDTAMSRLRIDDGKMEPSALSLELSAASSSRQSAFHINPSILKHDLTPNEGNAIHAV